MKFEEFTPVDVEVEKEKKDNFLYAWGRRLALVASVSALMSSCDSKSGQSTEKGASENLSQLKESGFLNDEQILPILQKKREVRPTSEAGFFESTKDVTEPVLRDFFDRFPKESENFTISSANFSNRTQNIILYFRAIHLPSGLQKIEPQDREIQESILDAIEVNESILRSVEEIKKATGYTFEFTINEELAVEDEPLVADLLKSKPGELQSDYVRNFKGMIQGPTKEKFLNLFRAVTPARTLAIQQGLTILGSTTKEASDYYDPIYEKVSKDGVIDAEEEKELKRLEEYREDLLLSTTQSRFKNESGKIILMPYGGGHYFKNNIQSLLSKGGNLGIVEITPRPVDEILARGQKK